MSNGKRRANWETVLEARMNVAQMLISNLNTDLQNQVDAMKKDARRDRLWLAVGYLTSAMALGLVLSK